jgi:siroheme synthase-like protein
MAYYPVFIELDGMRVLVIGGGKVAEEKIGGLLRAEAAGRITVVSPDLTPELRALHAKGDIAWVERPYQDGDLEGYDFCMAATDDGAVNAAVSAEGRRRKVWVNAADDPKYCDFILPSVVRQGQVVVAASTGGASPALARRLREELTAFLSEDYAPLADLLQEVRLEMRHRGIAVEFERWQTAIDARLRALVAQGRTDEARAHLIDGLGITAEMGAAETPAR